MQTSIMVTDGGPHPSDKWAEMTAGQIVDTFLVDASPNDNSDASKAARKSKRDLRSALIDIFDGHHASVQAGEQASLTKTAKTVAAAAKAADPVQTQIDPSSAIDAIMSPVNKAFAATPWAGHLAKPEVQQAVRAIIGQHTADVIHIERRWHHDRIKGA